MTQITDETRALEIDLFEGDFQEEPLHFLLNKIVTVRKPRPCGFCRRTIKQGERARTSTVSGDGVITRHIMCAECCNISIAWQDLDDTVDEATADAIDEEYTKRMCGEYAGH